MDETNIKCFVLFSVSNLPLFYIIIMNIIVEKVKSIIFAPYCISIFACYGKIN